MLYKVVKFTSLEYWVALNVFAPFVCALCCVLISNGSYDAIWTTTSKFGMFCLHPWPHQTCLSFHKWDFAPMGVVQIGWQPWELYFRRWMVPQPLLIWATTSIGGTHWRRIWGCGGAIKGCGWITSDWYGGTLPLWPPRMVL
jgi:hypothetical protein